MITLYILAGCVALAGLVFFVMIIVTVLRPPELPPLSLQPPPLERMVRALTPRPFAPAVQRAIAVPPPAPPPRVSPPPPPPPPPRAAAVAPAVRAPVVLPSVPSVPSVPAAAPAPRMPRAPVRPVYQPRRGRTLLRATLVLFLLALVAAGSAVAYPAMLDPLADRYEWFGADTIATLRDYAWAAHDAVATLVTDQ